MEHTFDTIADAIAADYECAATQTLETYRGFEIRITDTSGPNSFGYAFSVVAVPTVEKIREGKQAIGAFGSTVSVGFTQERNKLGTLGAVRTMFPPGELARAIAEAKAAIP